MIEIKIDSTKKDSQGRVVGFGSTTTIAAELVGAIGKIYAGIKQNDENLAEMFRLDLIIGLMPDSPTWRPAGVSGFVVSMDTGADKEDGDA